MKPFFTSCMCVVGSAERAVKEPVAVDVRAVKPTHVDVKCRLGQHKKSSESGKVSICKFNGGCLQKNNNRHTNC